MSGAMHGNLAALSAVMRCAKEKIGADAFSSLVDATSVEEDGERISPLMFATRRGDTSIVRALKNAGASFEGGGSRAAGGVAQQQDSSSAAAPHSALRGRRDGRPARNDVAADLPVGSAVRGGVNAAGQPRAALAPKGSSGDPLRSSSASRTMQEPASLPTLGPAEGLAPIGSSNQVISATATQATAAVPSNRTSREARKKLGKNLRSVARSTKDVGFDRLRELIDAARSTGLGVNAANKQGHTPLMRAASVGDTVAMMHLFRAGADVGAVDEEGYTALMWAFKIFNGDFKHPAVQFLLEHCSADPRRLRDMKGGEAAKKPSAEYAVSCFSINEPRPCSFRCVITPSTSRASRLHRAVPLRRAQTRAWRR